MYQAINQIIIIKILIVTKKQKICELFFLIFIQLSLILF